MEQAPALTPSASNIPPPFAAQAFTTKFILEKTRVHNWSEPGTGKTRASLDAISEARRASGGGRALVFAPKAILVPSWVNDCKTFTPHLRIAAAFAENRAKAFKDAPDVVVVNHDGIKWLEEHPEALKGFDLFFVDESTAFKNRTAQRSKAAYKVAKRFDVRVLMTGTPMPNGVLDVWHQALLVDDGERLGRSFFAFRNAVCEPKQVGPRPEMVDWTDKDGAQDAVADLLKDITVRFTLENIPGNRMYPVEFDLPPALRKQYDTMEAQALIELSSGENVSAINAGAVLTKLLQIASGAVYGVEGKSHTLDDARAELIAELADQRKHTLIGFMWSHQRNGLLKALAARKLTTAVIDGSTSSKDVPRIVERFQNGELRVLLAHPQSASHGLTLTRATTTIWASPTYDAERFEQFNRRIYRTGQTQNTETILVQARDTIESRVYDRLRGKLSKQLDLLGLIQGLVKEAA